MLPLSFSLCYGTPNKALQLRTFVAKLSFVVGLYKCFQFLDADLHAIIGAFVCPFLFARRPAMRPRSANKVSERTNEAANRFLTVSTFLRLLLSGQLVVGLTHH